MSDGHKSIVVRRTRINPHKPIWFTTDMIVAYALSVAEEAISFTYRKAEISSDFKR